jgi:hypothetical protein
MSKGLKNKFKKDSAGSRAPSNFQDYLDLTKCKDHKLEKLSLEKGKDYLLGILPFITKSDKCLVQYHPKKIYNGTDEQTYHMLVFTHSFLKFTNGSYICMKETYGKKCPICEYYEKLKEGMEYDDIKHLRPKFRAIYIVKDENDKIKILDVANNLFEEKWQAIVAKKEKRGEDFFPVYTKDEWGRYIDFTCKDKGSGFYELDAFDFPIIEDYDKKFSNHGIDLTDLLVVPDVKNLQEIIDNIGEVEEEDDTDNDENEEEEEDEIKKQPKKKKKKSEKDCPYDLEYGVDWDEYENCDKCEEKHEKKYETCKKLSVEGM